MFWTCLFKLGLDINTSCKPIFGGDFNLIFDTTLDASGGNPSFKKRALSKLIKILQNLDATDIFRVRHPLLKHFTFHRKIPPSNVALASFLLQMCCKNILALLRFFAHLCPTIPLFLFYFSKSKI